MENKNDEVVEKLEEYNTLEKIQNKIVEVEEKMKIIGEEEGKDNETYLELQEELDLLKVKEQE